MTSDKPDIFAGVDIAFSSRITQSELVNSSTTISTTKENSHPSSSSSGPLTYVEVLKNQMGDSTHFQTGELLACPKAPLLKKLAPIQALPPELITHIFSFLTDKENQWKTMLVCKSWYSATVDTLWFRPNIFKLQTLEFLLRTLDTPLHELTVDYTSLIRRINLTNIPHLVTDSLLLRMHSCSRLERLTLAGCSKLSDDSLVPLLHRNRGILSVDLTNIESLTDKTFIKMATNCIKLQGLYASGCQHLTDMSVNFLAVNCPGLKRMKLNGCHLITDDAVGNLILASPLLVELDLTGCINITNKTVSLAYAKLPQLREYRLSLNMNITDQILVKLPPKTFFDKLRIMDFSGCVGISDEGVGRLVSVAPKLRNVVLAKCFHITDRALTHLTKLGRNLHYIHLGHCNNITNAGVSALVKACHRIQYIDVACCNQIQDQAVKDIAQLPKLRRVGLVRCQNISDYGINAFIMRVGRESTLERIHLSYCNNISLSAITHLLNSCPRLTHLSLTGVPAFIREDLLQFCREPPPEFTQQQQQVFCVFSGQGVRCLRDRLNVLAAEHRLESQRMANEVMAAHLEHHHFATTAAAAAFLPNQNPDQQLDRRMDRNFLTNADLVARENHNIGMDTNPDNRLSDTNNSIPASVQMIPLQDLNDPALPNDEASGNFHFPHLRHLQELQEQQHQLALQVMARRTAEDLDNIGHQQRVRQNQVQDRLDFISAIENVGPERSRRLSGQLRFREDLVDPPTAASQGSSTGDTRYQD